MKEGDEGARPWLKLVYGNTRTTVHSTKQRKGRSPYTERERVCVCVCVRTLVQYP